MRYAIIGALAALSTACAHTPAAPVPDIAVADSAEILNVLDVQKNAWNTGSISGFMDGYWRSSDLRFASGDTVTKGWQSTLDRYRANYSDRSKMGTLDFTDLEVDQISPDAAIVHGRWQLQRASDAPHGLFTLVFRKFDGRWFIVSDTTTSGGD